MLLAVRLWLSCTLLAKRFYTVSPSSGLLPLSSKQVLHFYTCNTKNNIVKVVFTRFTCVFCFVCQKRKTGAGLDSLQSGVCLPSSGWEIRWSTFCILPILALALVSFTWATVKWQIPPAHLQSWRALNISVLQLSVPSFCLLLNGYVPLRKWLRVMPGVITIS